MKRGTANVIAITLTQGPILLVLIALISFTACHTEVKKFNKAMSKVDSTVNEICQDYWTYMELQRDIVVGLEEDAAAIEDTIITIGRKVCGAAELFESIDRDNEDTH